MTVNKIKRDIEERECLELLIYKVIRESLTI